MKLRTYLTIIATMALALGCCSGTIENEVGPYTAEEISPNVWHIQDCNSERPAGNFINADGTSGNNNCSDMYLIVGKKQALLVDLSNKITWADNAEQSLRKLVYDRTEGLPLTITFTHNHGDHTGMLPAFINETDVHFDLPRVDFEAMTSKFPEGRYSIYDEGKIFDLGGIKLSTLLVPGHTHGSIVFFIEDRNILLSGDAVGSGSGVWIFTREGFEEYVEGVDKLINHIQDPANRINADKLIIYGGHYWQKQQVDALKDINLGIQYLLDMQTLIKDIANGEAESAPTVMKFGALDTNLRHGQATITCNGAQISQWAEDQKSLAD